MSKPQASKRLRYRRANKNNRPWKTARRHCTPSGGKIKYLTLQDAEKFIKAMRFVATETGKVPVRAYRCRYCGLWHTTSKGHWDKRGPTGDNNTSAVVPSPAGPQAAQNHPTENLSGPNS